MMRPNRTKDNRMRLIRTLSTLLIFCFLSVILTACKPEESPTVKASPSSTYQVLPSKSAFPTFTNSYTATVEPSTEPTGEFATDTPISEYPSSDGIDYTISEYYKQQLRVTGTYVPPIDYAKLEAAIRKLWGASIDSLGMVYYETDTGNHITFNQDEDFQAASTIKVSIVMAVYDKVASGEFDINMTVDYIDELDADYFGTNEWYFYAGPIPLTDLIFNVIINSDNVAANMLIRLLGGNGHHLFIEKISNTKTQFFTNWITPYQSFCTMNWLYANPDKNPNYITLVNYLFNTPIRNRIGKYIPVEIAAEKCGDYEDYANDISIIYTEKPYVLIMYVEPVWESYELMAQTSLLLYNAHEGFAPEFVAADGG